MPTHKGIKLQMISQLEFGIHPEIAHPESSQFTNRSPSIRASPDDSTNSTNSSIPESKADRLLGRPSLVSVYIPSVAGSRFWLRFNIDSEAADIAPYYFFKLFMNGRNIASWGVNSRKDKNFQIMRGLFEPSDKWNYKVGNVVYKNMGLESRPFFFGMDNERSAAQNGGLIEVRVFRGRGRVRKMPEPPEFKDQEQFGIMLPSSGLHDEPQTAKFYDYHLGDAKDNPFACFRFHYRSWDSLAFLQLIPSSFPRRMLAATPSIMSLNGLSRDLQRELEENDGREEAEAMVNTGSDSDSATSVTPWMTDIFDEGLNEDVINHEQRDFLILQPSLSPPLYPERRDSVTSSRLARAVIEKPLSPVGYHRPLPDIPGRQSSLRQSLRHSRMSSTLSNAPSITPSLLQYLERDTQSPEPPEIGVASLVAMVHRTSPIVEERSLARRSFLDDTLNGNDHNEDRPYGQQDADFSEGSLQSIIPPSISSTAIKRRGIASPLANFSGITLRKRKKTPLKPSPEQFLNDSQATQEDSEQLTSFDNNTTLSVSDSEWLSPPVNNQTVHLAQRAKESPATAKKSPDAENGDAGGKKNKKDKITDGKSSVKKNTGGWYNPMPVDGSNTINNRSSSGGPPNSMQMFGNWY